MRIFALVGVVALAAPSILTAQCYKYNELQPTLRAYRIQKYGENYLRNGGGIPEPSDSDTCEKIREDMRVWRCRGAGEIPRKGYLLETDALGVPHAVKSAQKVKPHLVGGPAAKRRNISRAWASYRRELAKYQAEVVQIRRATTAYLALHKNLVANGCKHGLFNGVHSKRDPVLNPGR